MPIALTKEHLSACLHALDTSSQRVRRQLSEMEDHIWDVMHNQEQDEYDQSIEDDILSNYLKMLYVQLTVILDASGLLVSRGALCEEWNTISKIAETHWMHEFDSLDCPALVVLQRYIDGLRSFASPTEISANSADIDRLERLLKKTAVLLHRRKAMPTKEKDIHDVMREFLLASFDDYSEGFSIPGNLKNFKPDGGVRSLKTAIEFKFVDSETELKTGLSGILEDSRGYEGSNDWTQFISVIYMTEPFDTEGRFHGDIVRAGIVNWKTILVNGGKRASGRVAKSHKNE